MKNYYVIIATKGLGKDKDKIESIHSRVKAALEKFGIVPTCSWETVFDEKEFDDFITYNTFFTENIGDITHQILENLSDLLEYVTEFNISRLNYKGNENENKKNRKNSN